METRTAKPTHVWTIFILTIHEILGVACRRVHQLMRQSPSRSRLVLRLIALGDIQQMHSRAWGNGYITSCNDFGKVRYQFWNEHKPWSVFDFLFRACFVISFCRARLNFSGFVSFGIQIPNFKGASIAKRHLPDWIEAVSCVVQCDINKINRIRPSWQLHCNLIIQGPYLITMWFRVFQTYRWRYLRCFTIKFETIDIRFWCHNFGLACDVFWSLSIDRKSLRSHQSFEVARSMWQVFGKFWFVNVTVQIILSLISPLCPPTWSIHGDSLTSLQWFSFVNSNRFEFFDWIVFHFQGR